MSNTPITPSIIRLVELVEGMSLPMEDLRHLHRVKNHLRAKEKKVLSAHKVNPLGKVGRAISDRGIAI